MYRIKLQLQLENMLRLYGAPLLNIMPSVIYWNMDKQNTDVFSYDAKFFFFLSSASS
jgi:hypothetical protein